MPLSQSLSLRGGEIGMSHDQKRRKHGIYNEGQKKNSVIVSPVTQVCNSSATRKHSSKVYHDHDHAQGKSDDDLPAIEAILLPRELSIPQMIKMISSFLFTASLLESLRTSGFPYIQAVKSILETYGMLRGLSLNSTINEGGNVDSILKITALDEYLAKKICQGENSILPPKYLPSTLPLLGLMLSMSFYVGLTTLFPKWFVEFNVWLNYNRVNANKDPDLNRSTSSKLRSIRNLLKDNSSFLEEDNYYRSQFKNRNRPPSHNSNKIPTGLAVLIKISKRDQEMSSVRKEKNIQWLYRSESSKHPESYFIEFRQRRVYVKLNINADEKIRAKCKTGSPSFYLEENISTLLQRGSKGLSDEEDLEYYRSCYGLYNDLTIPIPTVIDAFYSRISSPLAVLQLIGRILAALEEAFFPALMNIVTTLGNHFMNARKSIESTKELSIEIQGNVENVRQQMFWTLRPRSSDDKSRLTDKNGAVWLQLLSSELLPGDIFYLPSGDSILPVDALLLEGNCIAQEAVLSGESTPQAKISVEPDDSMEDDDDTLSMDLKHRNSVLFAGTSVMHCDSESEEFSRNNIPKFFRESSSSVKCLVLRTGSYSSKGEIVRALSKNSGHGGNVSTIQTENDSLRLIIFLSSFAFVACASLFLPSKDSTARQISGFRRVIQCTRIAVSSIPSDLPLALNSIVHSCSTTLRKEADVVCSMPGSLFSAAQIDMIIFDKTGTLTSDTQAMRNVTNFPGLSPKQYPMAEVVLGGCHSLSSIKGEASKLCGDPLDKASLIYSNWIYNSTDKSAIPQKNHMPLTTQRDQIVPNAKKLWQIKSLPFDPVRRHSAAILLVKHDNGEFRLWKVVKGAPDSMRTMLAISNNMTKEVFFTNYDKTIENLGSKGIRIVTLAAKEVTHSRTTEILFPRGLPNTNNSKKVYKMVAKARKIAIHKFHIGGFEKDLKQSMTFAGFACFDASIRPSTPRVIKDIKDSGINVGMLTGDSSAAALSIAMRANFFQEYKNDKIATIAVNNKNQLKWTLKGINSGQILKEYKFNTDTSMKIIAKQKKRLCAIMITGDAIKRLLEPSTEEFSAANFLLDNLDKIAVFSSSSPQIKQQVLSILKLRCGKNIMFLGDGINDVLGMKTADISAALLNGYGSEVVNGSSKIDSENERRKAKFKYKKIGRQDDTSNFGTERYHRLKKKLEESFKDDNQGIQFGIDTIKKFLKDEYSRAKELGKGGAGAARILQEEDSLRKSLLTKSFDDVDTADIMNTQNVQEDCIASIKPGEASLAAPFTFLRPCIDGADTIIRIGVAAAAFSLSSQRYITLNSLMACYNLASLYRDGFRYGKYMWNVELALIVAMDQAQHEISSMPRSRIPNVRPPQSIFSPSVACSIILQSIIHLFVLTKGVHGAKLMQSHCDDQGDGLHIRFGQSILHRMCEETPDTRSKIFFGRRPFRPNLVTNIVFLLSIFQNVMISTVNHSGLLFNGSLLESRSFCMGAMLSILFCIAMTLEVQPSLNNILQLAPMPSQPFRFFVTSLFLFDGIASFLADHLCVYFLDMEHWIELRAAQSRYPVQHSEHAADIEECLLHNIRQKNLTFIKCAAFMSLIFILWTFHYS